MKKFIFLYYLVMIIKIDKSFNADALSGNKKIVIEVEAGRAVDNNQFLKDIFQACMMFEVEYLVIAVRNNYRGADDFSKIFTFLETLYISNRLQPTSKRNFTNWLLNA